MRLTYYVVGEATPRTKDDHRRRPTAATPSSSTTRREGVGRGKALGVKVETTNGVDLVVERPMYFRYSAARQRRRTT